MTATEAREKLTRLRLDNEERHERIQRLVAQGKLDEATKLTATYPIYDFDELYALALIAEGKEPLS